MKKRLLKVVLNLMLVISLLPSTGIRVFAINAEDTMSWLKFNEAHDTITGFNYQAGLSPEEITIPAKHTDGTVITAIGDSAFSGAGLKQVDFESDCSITKIGNYAFEGNLFTQIHLPETVKTLGTGSFLECGNLEKVDLSGYNITVIPDIAFQNCGSLKKVVLPENLISIGYRAFAAQDSKLEGTIKIPASVTTIGAAAFYKASWDCTLDLSEHAPGSITGQPWNGYNSTVIWAENGDSSCFVFNSETGVLCGLKRYNAETGKHSDGSVCSDPATHTEGKVTIPYAIENNEGKFTVVTAISAGAFTEPTGRVITSLDFESGSKVTKIGTFAFCYCSELTNVTLPVGLETIETYAFGSTSIKSIDIPYTVKTIAGSALYSCSKLTTVTIGDEEHGSELTTIPTSLFNVGMKKLTLISIPGKDKDTIANAPWSAIYAAIQWRDEKVPPQVVTTDDGDWEFNTVTKNLVNYLGRGKGNTTLTIPSSVTYEGVSYIPVGLESNAVNSKGSFIDVVIPGNIKNIGISAFYNTKIVGSDGQGGVLVLPEGLTAIEGQAFMNCNIKEVQFPKSLTRIDYRAFKGNQLTEVELQEGLTTLGFSAFENNKIAGDVVLPSTLTSIVGGTTGSFVGNDGIVSFHILQGRNGVVPATDDSPALPKANATVQGAAPFGAEQCANQVYYADDPQPLPSHTVMADTENNKAVIKLSIGTSDAFTLTKGISAEDDDETAYAQSDFALVELDEEGTGTSYANLKVDHNGTYLFTIVYGNQSVETDKREYAYSVTVDLFHTVTYDKNNGSLTITGSVPTDDTPYVEGCGVTVAGKGTMEIKGYTLSGWNTKKDGTGTTYKENDKMPMASKDVTLYAVWTVNGHTVTFDENGHGTAPEEVSVNYGEKVEEPDALTTVGYTFKGWYKEKDCINQWIFNTDTMPDEDITLYAKWVINTHTVTFDENGHGTTPAQQTVNFGEKIKEPDALTEEAYVFKGWYKEKDCINKWNFSKNTMPDEDITLYAKWVVDYRIIKGANQTVTRGSETDILIVCNGSYAKFTGVQIDGEFLEEENYEAVSGSTELTLYQSYVETLEIGVHKVTFVYPDGTASTNLTVKTDTVTPPTADSTQIGMWMLTMVASLAMLVSLTRRKQVQ